MNSGIIPYFPGKKIHGMFFDILKDVDTNLSERLHGNFSDKSFTVSSFLKKDVELPVTIEKDKKYLVRVTFLDENVFNAFSSGVLKKKFFKKVVSVDNFQFLVSKILFNSNDSPLAGVFSPKNLDIDDLHSTEIKLRFYTPTLFRIGDKHLRIPDAEKIFNSLLRKFNKYSSKKLEESISERFNQIKIKHKSIAIKRVNLGNYYLEGFTGNVVFTFPNEDKELLKAANILSYFSFYSGVGYKTTMGLGQTKRLN